jgi:hypothetical protein
VKETTGKTKMFATFNRMRWINTCYSAEKKLKEVLNSIKDERHVVYVATTDFLDNLPLNPYHSKLKSDNLKLFINEEINNIGLIEMAKSGVTFPKTKNIVVANVNSNSEKFFQKGGRGLLNDGGVATIHIISSKESFQLNWLNSALTDVPPNKIKYAN